jgi:hypothetical protein
MDDILKTLSAELITTTVRHDDVDKGEDKIDIEWEIETDNDSTYPFSFESML